MRRIGKNYGMNQKIIKLRTEILKLYRKTLPTKAVPYIIALNGGVLRHIGNM